MMRMTENSEIQITISSSDFIQQKKTFCNGLPVAAVAAVVAAFVGYCALSHCTANWWPAYNGVAKSFASALNAWNRTNFVLVCSGDPHYHCPQR